MPDYGNAVVRAKALARANKWTVELFKPANFKAIMESVEANDPNAFATACTNANLTTEEKDWLWNYLERCDNGKWGSNKVRDFAAASGW